MKDPRPSIVAEDAQALLFAPQPVDIALPHVRKDEVCHLHIQHSSGHFQEIFDRAALRDAGANPNHPSVWLRACGHDDHAGDPPVIVLRDGYRKEAESLEGLVGIAASLTFQSGAELAREERRDGGALTEAMGLPVLQGDLLVGTTL